jgi:PBP1b-binding outer membrane lipoprotein LpoB
MKNTFTKFFIFFILILSVLLISACSSIELDNIQEVIKKGDPEIEEIVICSNVDSDFAPVEPLDVFPEGTNSVYLSVKFKNFTPENHLRVVWYYKSIEKELASQEFVPDTEGSGYYSFNIKITGSFPPGKYNAQIYFDGQLTDSPEFTIE